MQNETKRTCICRFQKTSGILSGLTGTVSTKIGQMRHSESFRSIEEKMGSAIDNVRVRIITVFFYIYLLLIIIYY